MFELKRAVLLLMAAAGIAAGQPALTTIQDILYRADGTRFTGTMFIQWNSFQSGDTSNIATADLTLQIVNGVLNVKLVPTTTATAGAQYNITYNSAGRIQFTETWAVPPSSLTLRVRDVRISQGSIVGPGPITAPVQIGDVIGLSNALNVRPSAGVGFGIGRAAVINSAGQIDAAIGNLGDCVRVDGTSGPCGGGSGGLLPLFSDGEVPSGTIDGVNSVFTLSAAPSPLGSLNLSRNGLLLAQSLDYSLSGRIVTFFAGAFPQVGDTLSASYRYGDPNNPLGSLTAPQVICDAVGAPTSATTLAQLGSCTIPASLLGNGNRFEVAFQYGHVGTSSGFTVEIHWGATTIVSRAAGTADTVIAGKTNFGIYAGGQSWDAQNWGSSLALANSAGTASESTTANLTISFYGQMPGVTSDSVVLRNFTVTRYPAQVNP